MLILLCVMQYASLCADDHIAFKHLGINEGLSNGQINHITKDSQGFMWFSTSSGLNRYDGYRFTIFMRDNNDPNSIPDNYIEHVQEDIDGGLWIRTGQAGYVYYDARKETFQPAVNRLSTKYGIKETPSYLYVDKEQNVWCHSNQTGTYQYRQSNKKLIFYPVGQSEGLYPENISYVTEDKNGILYLYENGMIECIDRQSSQVLYRNHYLVDNIKQQHSQFSMLVDSDGDYWIYTKNQSDLWTYYTSDNRWEHSDMQNSSPYILSENIITDLKQDRKGLIWIATDHGGLNIINKELRSINRIVNDPFDNRSIRQNSLNSLYCDENGIIWVGAYKRGISYYSESIFKFKADRLSEFNHIRNFNADINVVVEDKQANLWLGTNSNGILYLNNETKERKIFQHTPGGKNTLSNNVIVSLLAASDGKLWAGTYQGGLNMFNGKSFTNYRYDPKNPNTLANNSVWALAEDYNGQIWVGTLGGGLQRLDPRTGHFTKFADPGSEFDTDYVMSICIGRDKNLYIGTATGITVFYPATGKFEKWTGDKKGTTNLSHQNIITIYEDSRGLLWISTQDGLNIYDRKRDKLTISTGTMAIGNDIIHAIVEDNNKNMWLTTARGVMNVIVNIDPKTGVYTYASYLYDELDGLQNQEFNMRSIIKTSRGEIIAGGIYGLSLFNPEQFKYNNYVPKVVFTELQLFNEEVKIDSVYSGNAILTQALNRTPGIELEYSQNAFSISFSSMNYILPEKTKYIYLLEGFNSNWLTADANKVVYTNLTPGKYVLKVKAVNSDGFTSDEYSELQIVIRPPYWSTPFAYLIYSLLIVGVLLLARKQLLRGERNKYRLVKIEQEAQQKHEIDDMKLRFFTNISHELRTPLTLIISPLENVIRTIGDRDQKQRLELVHRNAFRLLNMVNQLLDFRKSDVKGHQINLSKGDIVEFIRAISASFIEYSEKKNIHLTFFSCIRELSIMFDEDKVNKIMMNLLSNASKFTPAGGQINVNLSLLPPTDEQQEQLEIRVSDTGIGINDEDKERIFERFYQVQHPDNHRSAGSGVGLHLTKEFVLLHGGTITVLDNVKQGSVFIVNLPVNRLHTETADTDTSETLYNEELTVTEFNEATGYEVYKTDKRPVILIVDDSDDFRLFMKDCLKADYQVKEAPDGAKAWMMIPVVQPDIIVSDVMMPEMDGIELCKLVKTDIRTSHIPFVLLTARSAEEQKLEGLESGADDYITKPFNFDILTLRINKLLKLRHNRQESFNGQMEINPSEITITSLDEKLIRKAIQYVENRMNCCELSVEELSRELGMSRVHLYKKLLFITGKSPIEFIRIIRLKRAAQLLRESQLSVSEIAYQVGFNNPKYFSKYFKEEFGVLPSSYKNPST